MAYLRSPSQNADLPPRKKKRSRGRECASFGCYSRQYNSDGTPTGVHFFQFPQENPRKRRFCALIKRKDGANGFNVTKSTFICSLHFKDGDIKKCYNRWKLKREALPSQFSWSLEMADRKNEKRQQSSNPKRTRKVASLPMDTEGDYNQDNTQLLGRAHVFTQTYLSFISKPSMLSPMDENQVTFDHDYIDSNVLDDDLGIIFYDNEKLHKKIKLISEENSRLKSALQDCESLLGKPHNLQEFFEQKSL